MPGLWRNDPKTPEGKYLVQRRDGSVPDWPWFVLGARDPAALPALEAYADAAERAGLDSVYVADIRRMRDEWLVFQMERGISNPDAPPERQDDLATVAKMPVGGSA